MIYVKKTPPLSEDTLQNLHQGYNSLLIYVEFVYILNDIP